MTTFWKHSKRYRFDEETSTQEEDLVQVFEGLADKHDFVVVTVYRGIW